MAEDASLTTMVAVPTSPDEDDNISITSTLQEWDPDKEWDVDDILHEDVQEYEAEDGTMKLVKRYLIKWSGCDVYDSTWEPEENLSETLHAMWADNQRRRADGEEDPFDYDAHLLKRKSHQKARRARHRKRNILRTQRGIPTTDPEYMDDYTDEEDDQNEEADKEGAAEGMEPLEACEDSSSSEEAVEDSDVVEKGVQGIGGLRTARSVSRPKAFTGNPQKLAAHSVREMRPGFENGHGNGAKSTGTKTGPPFRNSSLSSSARSGASKSLAERPSITGYQGTARKVSAGAKKPATSYCPVPATQAPGALRPGGAGKSGKAGPTMKKSAKPINIFSEGKQPRQRKALKEAVSHPEAPQKLFQKHRYRRIAEKNSRDKGDMAPGLVTVGHSGNSKVPDGTSPIDKNNSSLLPAPIAPANDGFATKKKQPQATDGELATKKRPARAASLDGESTTYTTKEPAESAPDDGEPASKKKRKSVRFLAEEDEETLFSEPMEIDFLEDPPQSAAIKQATPAGELRGTKRFRNSESSGTTEQLKERTTSIANDTTLKSPGIVTNSQMAKMQSVDKAMVFGGSGVLNVAMNGVPRGSDSSWLPKFLATKIIELRHTCLAPMAAKQIPFLVDVVLWEGTITSHDHESALETVAENLRSTLLGLYCPHPTYNVLVYPSKSEEWRNEKFGQNLMRPGARALNFVIFNSQLDCAGLVRPAQLPDTDHGSANIRGQVASKDESRKLMTQKLLDWQYADLLPTSLRRDSVQPEHHNFFLVFPASAEAALNFLLRWLRAHNPVCKIFLSERTGSWRAFRNRNQRPPGIIIFHEEAARNIHRVKDLGNCHLFGEAGNQDEFWCLSESLKTRPIYPSVSSFDAPATGEIRFIRLFPSRAVLLLTPSFLASAPEQATWILKWFLKSYGNFSNKHKLVAAHGLHRHLTNVALAKLKQREKILEDDSLVFTDKELELNACGLTETNIFNHFKAASLAMQLHDLRQEMGGPHVIDEDKSSLVYADPLINPNDEQSLVNWFGWWSTLRLDQYRKFCVVGSGEEIKKTPGKKAELLMRIPRYSPVTVNDPDVVFETVQESLNERSVQPEPQTPQQVRPFVTSSVGGTSSTIPESHGINAKDTRMLPEPFRSALFGRPDPREFGKYLERHLIPISKKDDVVNNWRLYKFILSWESSEMAIHFDDPQEICKKMEDWARFMKPFQIWTSVHVAFFWTVSSITEDWHTVMRPRDSQRRDPWVVFFRPVNTHLHINNWRETEVIIWDPQARERFGSDAEISPDRLLYMQRQVVAKLVEVSYRKFNRSLEQVWVGGFHDPPDCDPACPPIDKTMKFLECTLEAYRIRNNNEYLPTEEWEMFQAGFKRVVSGKTRLAETQIERQVVESVNGASYGDADSLFVTQPSEMSQAELHLPPDQDADDDDDYESYIIFHPPRASKPPVGLARSRCFNKLYDAARAATTDNHASTHMTYSFTPTKEWYQEQRHEGRSYEHILVDDWYTIFNAFKIPRG